MNITTESKQSDGTAKGTDKQSSTLIDWTEVTDTPFVIASKERENEEVKDHYIMFGKYRISEAYENKAQAIADAQIMDWWKIMSVAHAIAEQIVNSRNIEVKEPKLVKA